MRDASRRHHASVFAGGVAFYGFLSMFPALAALVSTYGLLANPEDVSRQLDAVAGGLPAHVRGFVHDQIVAFTARSAEALGVEVAIGIGASIWAATKGMRALMTALSLTLGQEETRGFVRLNVTALLFTAGGVVSGAVAVAALVGLPVALSFLGLPQATEHLLRWLRWPAITAVALLGLAIVYHFGPAQPPRRWRWITLGSALATALWIGGSTLFSWFASGFGRGDLIDGSLAVVITLLTWFLLSAYVVILGAEVNVEVQRTRDRALSER